MQKQRRRVDLKLEHTKLMHQVCDPVNDKNSSPKGYFTVEKGKHVVWLVLIGNSVQVAFLASFFNGALKKRAIFSRELLLWRESGCILLNAHIIEVER